MRGLVLVFLSTLIYACDLSSSDGGRDCVDGEGIPVSEVRSLSGDFESIIHQIPGSVFITQGSPASLTIEGQANLLPLLSTEVSNNILTINFERCINSGEPFNAFIEVPDLRAVSLAGLGDIIFENNVISERLEASLVGAGNINLQGMADTLEVFIIGQGNISAFDMTSDICEVIISGQGIVEVTVNNTLDIMINGQGNVFYRGMPTVETEINGSGQVFDAN